MIAARPRACRRPEAGAAAVEFALVIIPLLLVIGAIWDLGLMLNAQLNLTSAAREGVRVAAIGSGDPVAAATDAFLAPAVVAGSFAATQLRTCPDVAGAQLRTEVTYAPLILPIGNQSLASEAVMRCGG